MSSSERLQKISIGVPNDLDAGTEPQCDVNRVFQLPEHSAGAGGAKCIGSGTLVYATGLTKDDLFRQETVCDFCHTTFSTE